MYRWQLRIGIQRPSGDEWEIVIGDEVFYFMSMCVLLWPWFL